MNSKTSDQTLESDTRAGEADGSLGEQLRRARESRGVSLRHISEQTRITVRHLEAIETSDYKHLPGGIFNRSFIKAYAKQINFDEKYALDLYAREARERGDDEEVLTSPRRSHIYMSDTSRSPAMTAVLSAVILGILVLVVYAGLHWYRRTGEPPPEASATAPQPGAANPAGQPLAQPAQDAAPVADKLNITVKAKDEVWFKALVDDEKDKDKQGMILAADETREFSPGEKLTLKYARSKAGSMEVTINGSVAKVPSDTTTNVVQEWVITRENYKQFLP